MMDDDDDDDLACSLCGDEGGGYSSVDVGGIDEHGQPMQLQVYACEACAPKLLTTVLGKVPDGAALIMRKRRGKLTLRWEDSLGVRVQARARQVQQLMGDRLKRALRKWHAGEGAHGGSEQ